jgi:hypothetical protein
MGTHFSLSRNLNNENSTWYINSCSIVKVFIFFCVKQISLVVTTLERYNIPLDIKETTYLIEPIRCMNNQVSTIGSSEPLVVTMCNCQFLYDND